MVTSPRHGPGLNGANTIFPVVDDIVPFDTVRSPKVIVPTFKFAIFATPNTVKTSFTVRVSNTLFNATPFMFMEPAAAFC